MSEARFCRLYELTRGTLKFVVCAVGDTSLYDDGNKATINCVDYGALQGLSINGQNCTNESDGQYHHETEDLIKGLL